jgi:hypothetical protein
MLLNANLASFTKENCAKGHSNLFSYLVSCLIFFSPLVIASLTLGILLIAKPAAEPSARPIKNLRILFLQFTLYIYFATVNKKYAFYH